MNEDILRLRLGMPEYEVLEKLAVQGARIEREVADMDGPAAVVARTKDGQMRIEFSPAGIVRRVVYVFLGHGGGEQEKVREAVIDRFGPPSVTNPMIWCRAVDKAGACPADKPSMNFQFQHGTSGVLELSAGGAP